MAQQPNKDRTTTPPKGNDVLHIVSNRTLITDEIVLLKKPEFINKDGDWCDADRLTINGEVKYFAYKSDLYGC